jgi:hypothetical protein
VKTSKSISIAPWLEKLETAIDLDWERAKLQTWKQVLDFAPTPGGFEVYRSSGGQTPGEWPVIGINDAIADPARMLLRELQAAYGVICRRTYHIPNIRANYGTGILPSLFGVETFWMEDSLDTLPTNKPLGEAAIDRLIEAGIPDLNNGFGRQVFETAEYFKEALQPYPKCREAIWIYHPDLQGPIDVVELLWGSDLFYAFYDQPDRVQHLTELVAQTYVQFMRRWMALVPPRDSTCSVHWGRLWKGQILLRDDSIVNLSPAMYEEFVKPYDERLLQTFGGGAIHFCGHVDHCIDRLTDSRWLKGINPSQPHLNDMRKIHAAAAAKGILLDCPRSPHLAGLDVTRGVVFSSNEMDIN